MFDMVVTLFSELPFPFFHRGWFLFQFRLFFFIALAWRMFSLFAFFCWLVVILSRGAVRIYIFIFIYIVCVLFRDVFCILYSGSLQLLFLYSLQIASFQMAFFEKLVILFLLHPVSMMLKCFFSCYGLASFLL